MGFLGSLLTWGLVSDDGLPERLKDDAGLEVTGGGEGEDPAAAPKAIRRRKKWIIIGIVLFLVIAGAVGGAVGGVMAKKARSDSQTSEVDKTKPDEADTKSGNVSISSRSIQATDRVASAVFMDWTSNNSTNTMLWLRGTHMFYQTSDGWIRWKVFNETSYNNGIGKESWGSEEGMIINEIKARPSSAIAVTPTVYYGEFLDGDLQRYSRRAVEKVREWTSSDGDWLLTRPSSYISFTLTRTTTSPIWSSNSQRENGIRVLLLRKRKPLLRALESPLDGARL